MAKRESKSPQSVYQEVADLKAAFELTRHEAISELLQQRAEIDQHLAALDYNPAADKSTVKVSAEPVAKSVKVTKAKKGKKGKKSKPAAERYCPICEVSGHDGRAHKSQGAKKKPFTQEELDSIAA